MADKLTQEQKAAHANNAMQKLDHPAFFARLQAHGIEVTEKDAGEYLALGEDLLAIHEKQAAASTSPIAAARALLHKQAAQQGHNLPGGAADQFESELRKFAIAQLSNDDGIAQTLALLV